MKRSPIRKETKKLHYKKYLYKVELRNEMADIFRSELNKGSEKLGHARKKLEAVKKEYNESGSYYLIRYNHRRMIHHTDFVESQKLYKILLSANDYKIRCENSFLNVYTNDKKLIDLIIKKCLEGVVQYWTVDDSKIEFLTNNLDTVIVDSVPEHKFKCYLNHNDMRPTYEWLANNQDKIKIGYWCLQNVKGGYANNNYFYVRDEKVLLLAQMVLGNCIRRVERLIYEGNIDKYTYESN